MDTETFVFYMGKTPRAYAAGVAVNMEQVLQDMVARHGREKANAMGLAFLAVALKDRAEDEQARAVAGPA